jgi:hypothetical protein
MKTARATSSTPRKSSHPKWNLIMHGKASATTSSFTPSTIPSSTGPGRNKSKSATAWAQPTSRKFKMRAASILLQILGWVILLACAWIALIELSFFKNGGGWALIGLVTILEYFIPICLAACVIPSGFLAYKKKDRRNLRTFIISGASVLFVTLETFAVLFFAPAGSGC